MENCGDGWKINIVNCIKILPFILLMDGGWGGLSAAGADRQKTSLYLGVQKGEKLHESVQLFQLQSSNKL